jgi:hypothetical protein
VLALAGGAELELRIALLPPISRGARDGSLLHARRLIELWPVADGDDVPLTEAFRFLDAEAVARAIRRTLYLSDKEYPNDRRHWYFPCLGDLLPELRERVWQLTLDGVLTIEAIPGVRGKRHRVVLPAELPRLTPDWELSRLILSGVDEFIDVRARRAPAEPIKKAWRKKPSRGDIKTAMLDIAKGYPAGAHPSESELWGALKARLGSVTQKQARAALNDYAPHLKGRRGHRSTSNLKSSG